MCSIEPILIKSSRFRYNFDSNENETCEEVRDIEF